MLGSVRTVVPVLLVALGLVACGGGASEEDVAEAVEKAVASAQAAAPPAPSPTPPSPTPVAPSPAAIAPPAPEPLTAPPVAPEPLPGSTVVPSVVGLDHQLAQDTLQSAGFYALVEEDATGAGRLLLVDRNWVVVEQFPAAGAKVASSTQITLRSKKKGE
jgi:hypothetical protein